MAERLRQEALATDDQRAHHLLWLAEEWAKLAGAQGARPGPASIAAPATSRRSAIPPEAPLPSAQQLRAAREGLGWSVGTMARKAGVSVWNLRDLETRDSPNRRLRARLARVIDEAAAASADAGPSPAARSADEG